MDKKGIFLAGPTREILNVKDRVTLLARVANQNRGFASSFPLAVSAINHFHRDHNAPKTFAYPFSLISLGTTIIPRRNKKNWFCKI